MHTVNINILMKKIHMISKYHTMPNELTKYILTLKNPSFEIIFLVFKYIFFFQQNPGKFDIVGTCNINIILETIYNDNGETLLCRMLNGGDGGDIKLLLWEVILTNI